MPRIQLGDRFADFIPGTDAGEIFDVLCPGRVPRPLAASLHGRVRPLNWAPEGDCALSVIDYTQDEGRRIYERSLRFLLLLAARDVLPGARVRIEHSVRYGLYIEVDAALSAELVAALEARMLSVRDAALPFERTRWTREQAVAHFAREGRQDMVRLLGYRSHDFFDVYRCGDVYEYFYGDMLPSTDHVRTFALLYRAPGIVLRLPMPTSPDVVAPLIDRPKLMSAFAQAAHWHDILGCASVADLNDMIVHNRLREFVRVNEALQEKSIAQIADRITESGSRVVFIAGPSSSGKTTFTNRLAVQLRVNALHPVMLSLDNYYRDLQDVPLGTDGQPDLECLEALDTPLLDAHLTALLAGDTVEIPDFSFRTNRRKPQGTPMRVDARQPILIEGIHGLNPRLGASIPPGLAFRVYVSALTTLNLDDHNRIRTTDVRLLRRLVRDQQFRHTHFAETLAMWPQVRRGEELFIFPFQEQADVMFNSSLAYEPAVLKKYAYPPLLRVEEDSPHYIPARRLVKFLNYFQTADVEDELGPTSILREFIGGCSFYLS